MIIRDKIYQSIRDDIVKGKILPGEPLRENIIADQFKCSRAPVREALHILKEKGFLAITPNHGAVVNKTTPKEIDDLYEILAVLEAKAVQWAVPHLDSKDLNELGVINNLIKKIDRNDPNRSEQWSHLNSLFHDIFRDKSGNEKLNWIINEVRIRITRYRYVSIMIDNLDVYIDDHSKIIEASINKEANVAKELMGLHILRAKNILLEHFRDFNISYI